MLDWEEGWAALALGLVLEMAAMGWWGIRKLKHPRMPDTRIGLDKAGVER